MIFSDHPDGEIVRLFVLGRLDRDTMAQLEEHLRVCDQCGQAALAVSDDRLVKLLRISTDNLAIDSSAQQKAQSP